VIAGPSPGLRGKELARTLAKKQSKRQSKPENKKNTKSAATGGFAALQLSAPMLEALKRATYEEPTPIQSGLIPLALKGVDVVGQAQTGTGKTAAFAIPILERLAAEPRTRNVRAMALVPTRELAVQVREEFAKLSPNRGSNCVAVYGGKPIRGQIEKLRRGVDVVVGTPGRVLDLLGRRVLLLHDLKVLVLDEADRMLDIGFRPDIEKILRQAPSERQTLLLSATVPPPIQRMAQRYMSNPEMLNFSPKELAVETIEQFYFTVDNERKFELLLRLLARERPRQAIIFCRTKRRTDSIARRLSKHTKHAACIHGDMMQSARDRVMERFRAGRLWFLVATDVVGRGIDVTSISHIVNFDIPKFCDDYVHRVGRAGRMGREGVAYSFVSPEEGPELTRIEQRINLLLKRDELGDLTNPAERAPSTDDEESKDAPAPPPPPPGRRGTRRHRRAL